MDPKIATVAGKLGRLLAKRSAAAGAYAGASRAEPGVNADIGQLNAGRVRLVGSEHEMKGLGSIKSKLQRLGGQGELRDTLRYTLVISGMDFTQQVIRAADYLKASGYRCTRMQTTEGKAGWERGYLGVNSNWKTYADAIFEVQFHTELTWHAKTESHGAYEAWRTDPDNTVKKAANTAKYQECFLKGGSKLGVATWKLDGVGVVLDRWFAQNGQR